MCEATLILSLGGYLDTPVLMMMTEKIYQLSVMLGSLLCWGFCLGFSAQQCLFIYHCQSCESLNLQYMCMYLHYWTANVSLQCSALLSGL